jgi:hypothetical protein
MTGHLEIMPNNRTWSKPRLRPCAGADGALLWVPELDAMRVPNKLLNGIVFLGYRENPGDPSTERFAGTGFLVGVELGGILFLYLVTAHHVAKALNNYSDAVARVNDIDGNPYTVSIPQERSFEALPTAWHRHNDLSVDLTVRVFLPDEYDRSTKRSIGHGSAYVPEAMFIREMQFEGNTGIGIGDEIFIAGLFHFVYGKQSNSPIIRIGNIAMLPNERVYSREYGFMEAYLIEARSLGGISGSPVFVRGTVNISRRGTGLRSCPSAWCTSKSPRTSA